MLRFPEYTKQYKKTIFEEVVESNLYGPRFDASDYNKFGNVKTIRGTDVDSNGEIKYEQVPLALLDENMVSNHKLIDGDLIVITTADCGAMGVFRKQEIKYISSAYGVRYRLNTKGYPFYFKYYFQTWFAKKEVGKYVRKATVSNLPGSDVLRFLVNLPEYKEQQKIADFLSAVDKKIRLLKQKHNLLQQYKKGVMQQLFSQQIRFKDDNGKAFSDWQEKTLAELADKVSNKNKDDAIKNVLTNSAKRGIVNQLDYFDKDIANENNLTNYSIVDKDDFVYNPRISESAPVGPIKRNHLGQGIMSPLYTVFRLKETTYLDYLEMFFQTTYWHRYMNTIANFGARHDRMNITMGDFFKLPINLPGEDEMKKIVAFTEALNKKVDLVGNQVQLTQTFKKGLLQQMFV